MIHTAYKKKWFGRIGPAALAMFRTLVVGKGRRGQAAFGDDRMGRVRLVEAAMEWMCTAGSGQA